MLCRAAGSVSQLPLYLRSALGCRGPVLQASWALCERPLFKKGEKELFLQVLALQKQTINCDNNITVRS